MDDGLVDGWMMDWWVNGLVNDGLVDGWIGG